MWKLCSINLLMSSILSALEPVAIENSYIYERLISSGFLIVNMETTAYMYLVQINPKPNQLHELSLVPIFQQFYRE